MKRLVYLFAALAVMTLAPATLNAQCGGDSKKEAKLYALTFTADYCGACKKMKPELQALMPKLEGKNVEFITFDFSSDESKQASVEKAEKLGVSDIYQENQATGFVLLVDSESKETLARLNSRQTSDEMYRIVVDKL